MTARAAERPRAARSWAPAGFAASLLRLAIAAVRLTTGAARALDLLGFSAIIAEYRVLPAGLAPSAAALVAGSEVALGAWLLTGTRAGLAALASAARHAIYAVWTGNALARGLDLENCGCFGVFWGRPLAFTTLLEDAALVALSLVLLVAARLELLGVGLDEGTAVVVRRDAFTVVGRGRVLVTDAADHAGQPFRSLRAGDRFDLARWELLP